MALETLNNVTEIGGIDIHRVEWNHPDGNFIEVDDKHNAITFKIQNGPIKEHGVNGCQVDDIILAARTIISGLNKNFPCRENSCAITKLDEAMQWLAWRTRDCEKRGVEGKNED